MLNKIILATKQNKSLGPLAACAITLLNSTGEIFSHRDYQGISIPGAILQNSTFYGTLLQQSNLSFVDFQGADLTLTNLQSCQMRQVSFGKFPYYQIDRYGIYQFSPDLTRLLVGKENGEISIFNLTNYQVETSYRPDKHKSKVMSLSWDIKEQLILSRHLNNKAYLIEQKNTTILPIKVANNRPITSLALTVHDQIKLIAVGCQDGFIQLLHYNESALILHNLIKETFSIDILLFSGHSHLIVGNYTGELALYYFSENNWQLVRKFKAYESILRQLDFIAEENAFITCGDHLIKLWDINTGELIKIFNEASNSQKYTLNCCYPFVATSDGEGNLYLWHINALVPIIRLGVGNEIISQLQLSPQNNAITCVSEKGKITTHYLNQEILPRKIPSVEYCKGEQSINISVNEEYLLSALSNTLYLQELKSWQLQKKIDVDELEISCTAINKDGAIIVAGGSQLNYTSAKNLGGVFIFANRKEYCLPNKNKITAISITTDSQYILYGDDQAQVSAWHIKGEKTVWSTTLKYQDRVTKIAYCYKQSLVYVLSLGESKSTIICLKISDGNAIECHEINDQINCLLISKYLVANGGNGNIYFGNRLSSFNHLYKVKLYKSKLDDIAINNEVTLIVGVCAVKSSILIWQREDKKFILQSKIIHPDKPCQVFLFDTPEILKIISRSQTGSVRYWSTAKKTVSGQFKLLNENGHHQLSLRAAKIDGVQGLSRNNVNLLHQSHVQGYPYINSDHYYSQLINEPEQAFAINDWQALPLQNHKTYQLLISHRYKAVKICLLLEPEKPREKKINKTLTQALSNCFKLLKKINYLDLSDNSLDDASMEVLAAAIQGQIEFEQIPLYQCNVLILTNNQITKQGLRTLLDALVKKPSIKQLQLNHNYIDCSYAYLKNIISFQVEKAKLVKLGLKFNFIPKGILDEEDRIRFYSTKAQANWNLIEQKKRIKNKITFFHPPISVSNYEPETKVSTPPFIVKVSSLIASIDKDNFHKKFDIEHGMMGLFIKKSCSSSAEQAYLFIEGILKFGQRYLICCNLSIQSHNAIHIQVTQYTPQDFIKFTHQEENIFLKSGLFMRKNIKKVINTMMQFCHEEMFYDQAILFNNSDDMNCLKWVMELLRVAGIGEEIKSWKAIFETDQNTGCTVS